MWRWLDIRGRGQLGEFWLVFYIYLLTVSYALLGLSSPDVGDPWRPGLVTTIWLATLVLWVSAIRRFHDTGESGWTSLYLMPAPLVAAILITWWDAEIVSNLPPSLVGFAHFLSGVSAVVGLYGLRGDSANGRNRFGPESPRGSAPLRATAASHHRARWLNPAGRGARSELLIVSVAWLLSIFASPVSVRTTFEAIWLQVADAAAVLLTPVLALASIRRAHDLGWPATIVLAAAPGPIFIVLAVALDLWEPVFLIPVWPTLILFLIMLISPGEPAANQYGENPRPPKAGRRAAVRDKSEDFTRLRRRMTRAARTALVAVPAEQPTMSRLGGAPDLPDHLAWPEHLGQPLCFVAQLDLSEVRAAGGPEWLPSEGVLSFFVALDEAPYGERTDADTTWRVLHHTADVAAQRRDAPASAPAVWAERRIAFTAVRSCPSLSWLGVEGADLDVDDHELDELADLPSSMLGDGPEHLLGGYPGELQDAPLNLICALAAAGFDPSGDHSDDVMQRAWRNARGWRQLLQIDYDAELGMRWPGSGRFYFLIRERDALKADFSKARLLSQFS